MSFILLVEPDADSATAIQEVLVSDGLEVKIVASPDAALQIAAAQAPKLVIVSTEVRGSGRLVESFARAKGGPGSIAVVAAGKRNSRKTKALLADETVTAPFSADDLKQAVERCWQAERGELAGSSPKAGQQLSSEEIFGDVLAELSGEDEADSALDEIEAGLANALQEIEVTSAPSTPTRPPAVGGDVDALLASTLADLDLSPSAKTPTPLKPTAPPLAVPPSAEPAVAEDLAGTTEETETLEDLVESAVETGAIDQDAIEESEGKNRTVLIAAIAGTAIIGVLLIVLLNFTGGGEPETSTESQVDELPIVGQTVVSPPGNETDALELDAEALATEGDAESVSSAPVASEESEEQQPEATDIADEPATGEDSTAPETSAVTGEDFTAPETSAVTGEDFTAPETSAVTGEDFTAPEPLVASGTEPAGIEEPAPSPIVDQPENATPDIEEPAPSPIVDQLENATPDIEEPAPSPIVDQPENATPDVAPAADRADELESQVAEVGVQEAETEASDAGIATLSEEVADLTEGPEDPPAGGEESAIPAPVRSDSVPASAPPQESPAPVAAQVVRSQEVVTPIPAASDEVSAEAPTTPDLPAASQVREAGDVPPELISFTRPRYPEMAKKLKIQGTVVVSVLVNEAGKVVDAKIVEGVLKSFDQEVLRAARGARFKPATRAGEPVSMWRNLAIPMHPDN